MSAITAVHMGNLRNKLSPDKEFFCLSPILRMLNLDSIYQYITCSYLTKLFQFIVS